MLKNQSFIVIAYIQALKFMLILSKRRRVFWNVLWYRKTGAKTPARTCIARQQGKVKFAHQETA